MRDLPKTIAHFRVTRKLGAGGMGVVYEAVDEKLRRTVALKVLPPEYTKNEERRSRFLREARSAAAVAHANIATVYEVGEDEGHIYIAMELVEGSTLRKKLEAGALSVQGAVNIGKQIAKALGRAHDKGVIHRDLKPENVMVGNDEEVKLLDFGLAKLRELAEESPSTASVLENEETSSNVTQEGHVLGTPGYMSPEQATGKPVDRRTDIFSLGVVLYEMLSGARPFGSGSTMEVIIATSRDEPKPLAELAPQAPEDLCAAVTKCLSKAPDGRFEGARELLDALEGMRFDASSAKSAASRSSRRSVDAATPSRSPTPDALASTATPALAKRHVKPFLAAVLLGALGIAGLKLFSRGPAIAIDAAPSASSSAAKPAGTTIVDLPKPTSCTPEGIQHLQKGLESFRVGGWVHAHRAFSEGVKVDPNCPELRLRFAMTAHFGDPAAHTREVFRTALHVRPKLTARDQGLLDALEPILGRDPPEASEARARLKKLVDLYPMDAEIVMMPLTFTAIPAAERKAHSERALAIDPDFADARQSLGRAKADLGDFEGGLRELAECTRRTPSADDCVLETVNLMQWTGRCQEMESAARALTARDPAGASGYLFRALALEATGASDAAIADVLQLFAARLPPQQKFMGDHWNAMLPALRGSFTGALEALATLARSVEGNQNLDPHARHDLLKAEILLETGQDDAAAKTAAEFLKRRRAWMRTTGSGAFNAWALAYVEPRMAIIAARGKPLSDEQRRAEREAWAAKDLLLPLDVWAFGTALFASSREEAVAALDTIPPRESERPAAVAIGAAVGRALLLAGRPSDALRWIREATTRCEALMFPFEHTRAHLLLGQVLEATGDTKGACAAYGVVVRRWGNAKPASVSARDAAARLKAIGCQ